MDLNIRFQIASILVYLVLAFHYFRSKKQATMSSKCFTGFVVSIGLNLIFDLITLYEIFHVGQFSSIVIRLTHQIFYLTILATILSLFLYIEALGRGSRKRSYLHISIKLLPSIFAILVILFGDLKFTVKKEYAYSHGPMVNMLYLFLIIYMVCSLIDTYVYQKELTKTRSKSIRLGILIWGIAGIIEYFHPQYLITSISFILLFLYLYLCMENPNEYITEDTKLPNEKALKSILTEKLASGKVFYIVNVVLHDLNMIHGQFGTNGIKLYLTGISSYFKNELNQRTYQSGRNRITLLLEGDYDDVLSLVKNIERRFQDPWNIMDSHINTCVHVDILECPRYADDVNEAIQIMNFAGTEKSRSTAENFCFYVINEDDLEKKNREYKIEELLRAAIERNGIEVYYQPVYSVEKKSFHALEALARLSDTQTMGYVNPGEFIPIAEKKGLMIKIGNILFEKICEFASRENLKEKGIDFICVNISGIQGVDTNLAIQFKQMVDRYHLSYDQFNFEIEESIAIRQKSVMKRTIEELRAIGFRFSLDDFGTSYSNFAQIIDQNYDFVKIGESFISHFFRSNNEKSLVILEHTISMLKELGVHIIAEGVETAEAEEWMKEKKVSEIQGYFYAKPMPEQELLIFLKEHVLSKND